jgi:hypothetical protein
MRGKERKDRGAVSLFVVIFAALLITTITITFVRLMVQNQQQAIANDLSKSALDSAFAGVEDAKRAIVTLRNRCTGNAAGSAECVNLARALNDSSLCDSMQQAGIAGSPGDKEVLVKQNEGDELLLQAYTCVKVQMNTPDFIGSVTPNASRLIPLRSSGPFNQVTVEWFSQKDLQTSLGETNPSNAPVDLSLDDKLQKLADWPKNRPPVLRVQLIQFGDSFNLSDFNSSSNGQADNQALFLIPSKVGRNNASFADDVRQSHISASLEQIRCDQTFSSSSNNGQYACSATITLPDPIGGNSTNRRAYLRLSEIYNSNTTFRITMANNAATPVFFNGVQPLIDSTGRANDLFRRVRSRVELDASAVVPVEAAVDITGSLCKTFLVTDKPEDFTPGNCQDN